MSTSHSKRLSVAVIISVVTVIILVLAGTILFLKRCRSQHRVTNQNPRYTTTISPFTLLTQIDGPTDGNTPISADSNASGISACTTARQQLLAAQEKTVDLEDEERRTSPRPNRMSPPVSTRSTAADIEAQPQASREQMSMLLLRMNALEANADSALVPGISGEPPPEYI
ncbi:hypothetical protein B0H19DRAFT_1067638 [Mycena capillaripes]|nr:hypothetical protein B0H19DRAFT_1067638 [Mycena capillaripes]